MRLARVDVQSKAIRLRAVLALPVRLSRDLGAERVRAVRDQLPVRRSIRPGAGEALNLAPEQIRSAFEDAPIGIAIVAPGGRCLRANAALCAILGYSEAELRERTFEQITHSKDIEADRELQRRLLAGEVCGASVERRYVHRDGRDIFARLSVSLVRDQDGQPLHFIRQIQDVTARLQADRVLRVASSRTREIFDHAPVGILIRERDGRIAQLNDVAAEHLGGTVAQVKGTRPGEHLDRESDERIRRSEAEMVRTHRPVTDEMTVRHPDGGTRHVHLVRYPLLDDAGAVAGFASFSVDITDRTLAEQEREQALRELQDAQRLAAIGSWFWDPASALLKWSDEMFTIFGREPSQGPASVKELIGDYVIDQDREHAELAYASSVPKGLPVAFDCRVCLPDGTLKTLHGAARPDPDRPGCFLGTVQDVTELRATAAHLREAEERFRGAFEYAPTGMALCDLQGNFQQVNAALCEITGYARERLCELSSWAITPADEVDEGRELLARVLAGEADQRRREHRYVRPDGQQVWVAHYVTVLRNRDGEPVQLLMQVLDITERRMLETQLRHYADHDPLTGLLNRRGLKTALEHHAGRVSRYGERGALLVLDLDHFKTVNDTLGHSAGDKIIISVAGLLARRLRCTDTIARLGGDEFAILLPEADAATAEWVATSIVQDVREQITTIDGGASRRVTASVGVLLFRNGMDNAEEALVNADLAMYDAKEGGRDQISVYADVHDQSRMKTRLSWIHRLGVALQEERFVLHAQPIADLRTGTVSQYELLVRMLGEAGELIGPGAFLHLAERYDLVQELDQWVTRAAIELLQRRVALAAPLAVEVNLSGKSLGDERLLAVIEDGLRGSRIPAGSLIFEVTETAAVANIEEARRFADRLTELGCRFALDDFGAGFDSFVYLKYLPFDFLKIDGEFVVNCTRNRTDQLVIESLVSVARGLGKRTIAEFVEDRPTQLFLRDHGVDFAQGYHIGRPVPISEALSAASGPAAARAHRAGAAKR